MIDLSKASQGSLESALAAMAGTGPLPVIVVTSEYEALLHNWIRHLNAIGIHRYLVVAMDAPLMEHLIREGIAAARCEFDGSAKDFWLKRLLVWDFLLQSGVEIIQSDVDAVWLRNPMPEYFGHSSYDLLFSQGTFHPLEIHNGWHFVLCTGLFWARPRPAIKTFFSALKSRARAILEADDQTVINRLLYESHTIWDDRGIEARNIDCDGHDFTCYSDVLPGFCSVFAFRLGLLPHDLFQRMTNSKNGAYVKHVRRPKSPGGRIEALREAGCWIEVNA